MGYSEEAKAAARAAYKTVREAGGSTKEADAAAGRARNAADPEFLREIRARWNKANPEKRRACDRRANAKRHNHAPPDPAGPTLDELVKAQGGVCAICRTDFSSVRPCLDHCHISGKIRSALCSPCNRGLGFFKENVSALMTAASYIIQHRTPDA